MTNLNEVTRFQKSIHPKELKGDKILSSEVIREEKTSNSVYDIEKIDTEKYKGIYLVSIIAWSLDDVSEVYHAFVSKADAENCFDYYNRPLEEIMNEPAPPPVQVFKDGEKNPRYLNLDDYNGFAVASRYGGELLKPMYSKRILEEKGWINDEIIKDDETDIRSLIYTQYEIALIRYDKEVGGVKVIREQVVRFIRKNDWETGFDYLTLAYKYPEDIFNVMKPFLQFHSEEIEEEGDWKGWYVIRNSPDFDKLKNSLETIGWTINYEDTASDDD